MQHVDLLIKNACEIVLVESTGPVMGTDFSALLKVMRRGIAIW